MAEDSFNNFPFSGPRTGESVFPERGDGVQSRQVFQHFAASGLLEKIKQTAV
jgi:hypothetical protein